MRGFFQALVFLPVFCHHVAIAGLSDPVKVCGHAPGYEGEEITFYTLSDRISLTPTEIAAFTADTTGLFNFEIDLASGPVYIFAHTGIYYVYMYVEPGKEYRVILPEKREKSTWEEMNPYFEGVPTHIAILNHDSTELNNLIRSFDMIYEPLFGEPLVRISTEKDRILFDSVRNAVYDRFKYSSNPWFDDYIRYKLGLLKLMSQLESVRAISGTHFRNETVKYDNVAYMDLFNQVYNRYFLFFSRTVRGSRIFDDINKYRSLQLLRNTLTTDDVLGEERLLEMVILKGLHDAFYGSDFSRSGLLTVLDSLELTTVYPEHKIIAGQIRVKVTRLLAGYEPPQFSLMNREGDYVSLSDFRGDYVYLNFCSATSYSCLSEYDILKRLHETHGDYLRIVTIFIDESYEAMTGFLERNDFDWDFLYYGNQPSVLKNYDVRMFPCYYLVGPEGTLLLSPAPSPAEDFEMYLFRIMRSRRDFR